MALTVGKIGVAMISGSVGVLSEGIHSFLDLVSAAVSFFTVRAAGKPADSGHPYGHGKIETLSALFEAILLILAGAWISYEAYQHLADPHPIRHAGAAIAAIFISMVVSYFAYTHQKRVAQKTGSSALHVNALHFLSDVVASAGILAGLVLMKVTGWQVIDPIIAFAVAGYIFFISATQVKESLFELADVRLPEAELAEIQSILGAFRAERKIEEAHDLRTRRSGAIRHVDFHLVVCRYMTVEESHGVCDEIEARITARFPGSSVNIHVEPCEDIPSTSNPHCSAYLGQPRMRSETV